jgi:glycosyltransferase involved in cell wall biosynthesis
MIGKGVLHDEIMAYIQHNNLASSVILQGYVQYDQLPQWFAASDLFVLLSHYDPFPLVINEALCSGLPVIATEMVGAVDDLVKNGVTGLVVPPKNVEAVVGALAQLLHDDEKRQAMSVHAQQTMRVWNSDLALAGLRKAIASVTRPGKR